MIKIDGRDIADCWEQLVFNVMHRGDDVKDERGSNTKELLNIVTTIHYPFIDTFSGAFGIEFNGIDSIKIPKDYYWSGDKLEIYAQEFIDPCRKGFVYTYGNRLREAFGIDQINLAIARLNNCNESRRALSITWNPTADAESSEVPCMILIDYKIRNNILYTTALWRSHDIFGAWFPNAVGLACLSRYVRDGLKNKNNIGVGPITIHSISGHIYEHDFESAEKIVKKVKNK